jgi:DNA invertase Pin-like site-specific DNA recombinase
MGKRAAIYVRVSTDKQTIENQLRELRQIAEMLAGLKRAVEKGSILGRPKISAELERRIQAQLRAGKGILATAKELGVGTGTVHRIAQAMRPFKSAAA